MSFFKIFAISTLTATALTVLYEQILTIFPNNKVTGLIVMGAIIWVVLYIAPMVLTPRKNNGRKRLKW